MDRSNSEMIEQSCRRWDAQRMAADLDARIPVEKLLHGPADFRRGKRLGAGDHVVVWSRPPKPQWMNQATYEQIPESVELREVEVAVAQPGFRTEVLVVVTTLTDGQRYTRDDLAELYHRRWLAELDIRAIKITMGMDLLRAKSPEMVRREIWTCLLAYNLVR
jgi:hypothetical protein